MRPQERTGLGIGLPCVFLEAAQGINRLILFAFPVFERGVSLDCSGGVPRRPNTAMLPEPWQNPAPSFEGYSLAPDWRDCSITAPVWVRYFEALLRLTLELYNFISSMPLFLYWGLKAVSKPGPFFVFISPRSILPE
jgi:hypothetical protein